MLPIDTSIDAAYIFNPKLDALQLLKAINDEFGIDSQPDNTKDLIDILNGFLIEKKAAKKSWFSLMRPRTCPWRFWSSFAFFPTLKPHRKNCCRSF
jgi:hypothetical protein